MNRGFGRLPTSIRDFGNRHVALYIRPSRMRANVWDPGAEWLTATSLDFQEEQIKAGRVAGGTPPVRQGVPLPPDMIVGMLYALWADIRHHLDMTKVVCDVHAEQGVSFRHDYTHDTVSLWVDIKVWPAVPGVTIPEKPEDNWG